MNQGWLRLGQQLAPPRRQEDRAGFVTLPLTTFGLRCQLLLPKRIQPSEQLSLASWWIIGRTPGPRFHPCTTILLGHLSKITPEWLGHLLCNPGDHSTQSPELLSVSRWVSLGDVPSTWQWGHCVSRRHFHSSPTSVLPSPNQGQ